MRAVRLAVRLVAMALLAGFITGLGLVLAVLALAWG